jgi:hypothetical protein
MSLRSPVYSVRTPQFHYKVKLSLCLTKYYAMKTYGRVVVSVYAFST